MIHDDTADTCEPGPFTGASVDLFFAAKVICVVESRSLTTECFYWKNTSIISRALFLQAACHSICLLHRIHQLLRQQMDRQF